MLLNLQFNYHQAGRAHNIHFQLRQRIRFTIRNGDIRLALEDTHITSKTQAINSAIF